MRAAIYARSALEDRNATDQQVLACKARAAQLGLSIDESRIYVDCGVAGNDIGRLEHLQMLVSDAESVPRPFDYVLVSNVSRLGRDLAGVVALLQRLWKVGVTTDQLQGGANESGNLCALLVRLAATDLD